MSCLSNSIFHNVFVKLSGSLLPYYAASLIAMTFTLLPALSDEVSEPFLPPGLSIMRKMDGYYVVSGSEGHGIYSAKGTLIIPARYDDIKYVGDRKFVVRKFQDASTSCWLFDDKGTFIARLPDWTLVNDSVFHEGLLNIGDSYSPTAFVDEKGKVLPNFDRYTDVKEFSDGLAAASLTNRDGRWAGFINHQGKMVIGPFENADVFKFENGRAIVAANPKTGKPKAGLVSSKGTFVVPMIYDSISSIGNDKFCAQRNNQVAILDSDGKVVIQFPADCTSITPPDKFDKNTWIACGFKGKLNQGLKWGFCDVNGKVVLTPRFALASSFIGNRAVAYEKLPVEGLACGVIDRKGRWLVEPKYKYITIIDDNHWNLGELVKGKEPAVIPNAHSARALTFQKALQSHDLIGMSLRQFEELVGKLEFPPYLKPEKKLGVKVAQLVLVDSMCGQGSEVLTVALDANDCISGWRVLEGGITGHSQPWITENVCLDDGRKGFQLGNLVPKK
jgi:hypothetical protein